ncbi:MAG TPA: hypothetical protein VE987_13855, partial [Polyangiaceae bacterium]|nr:hypothetical protein [Polyangiaceae bacterium]
MLPSRQRLAAAGFAAGMLLVGRPAAAGASVWVIDDGEKIRRDATETAFERGEHNPVWQPGGHARVFAMRGESVALQVVVEAGEAALDEVTVSLPELDGPGGAALGDSRAAAPGGPQRPIERFVEHFVEVRRPSGGRVAGESLGWSAGAGPPRGRWVGPVPDALVPVEASSSWCPYPMHVAAHTNGVVWIDLNVPRDARAGTYRGAIDVRERGRELAVVAVELSIADASLPDGPPATVYYDPDELARRVGPGA